MEETLKQILAKLDKMDSRLENLEEGQQRLEYRQEQLEYRQEQLENGQQQLVGEHRQLKAEIAQIRESQIRMEISHGEKLAALFDGFTSLSETLADHTRRLERIEDKLEIHDIQIQVLDKTKSNKRTVK